MDIDANDEILFDTYYPQFKLKTRSQWQEMGKYISSIERIYYDVIPTNKYVTLRLDGCGFSDKIKYLRCMGIIEDGIA